LSRSSLKREAFKREIEIPSPLVGEGRGGTPSLRGGGEAAQETQDAFSPLFPCPSVSTAVREGHELPQKQEARLNPSASAAAFSPPAGFSASHSRGCRFCKAGSLHPGSEAPDNDVPA